MNHTTRVFLVVTTFLAVNTEHVSKKTTRLFINKCYAQDSIKLYTVTFESVRMDRGNKCQTPPSFLLVFNYIQNVHLSIALHTSTNYSTILHFFKVYKSKTTKLI